VLDQLHPDCPLITSYTRNRELPRRSHLKNAIPDDTLHKLFYLRNWDIKDGQPIPFTWPSRLRRTIWSTVHNADTGEELKLRQYQRQQAHHLCRMDRFMNGDSVGLGKTVSTIAATCWIREREPVKVIVLCTKSTSYQWADEYARFSTMRARVMTDRAGKKKSYEARAQQLEDFLANDDHDVLVAKYTSLVGKRRSLEGEFDDDGFPVYGGKEKVSQEILRFSKIIARYGERVILVLDESHKFKTPGSQIRTMVQYFQRDCGRVWVLTATAIKNSLEEFYSIASAIGIRPFGYMQPFRDEFCIYSEIHMGQGRVKKLLKGYRNVARFKQQIRPFFLGRSQAQVNEPMPRLTTIIHPIDLDEKQAKLLLEDIPSGKFLLPPSIKKVAGEIVVKDRDFENEMTRLSVYQLVANHPALLDPTDQKSFLTKALSPKEEALLDMLDGDLRGEKVITFTKYRSWIDRLEALTKDNAFTERKFLRITGNENEKQRENNKALFQDPTGKHDWIVINTAAIEGVNLQQAGHMIALDLPWSWGDLIQLVGRMVRMASPHSACTLHIFVARGSIDEYVVETLKGKKGVFEMILGESHSAGLLDDRTIYDLTSGMEQVASDEEFQRLMTAHCKSVGMKVFLQGEMLAEAQENSTYKMTFEPGAKKKHRRKTEEELNAEHEELAKRW
jgi:SNF2 family DNA or RNA helicase